MKSKNFRFYSQSATLEPSHHQTLHRNSINNLVTANLVRLLNLIALKWPILKKITLLPKFCRSLTIKTQKSIFYHLLVNCVNKHKLIKHKWQDSVGVAVFIPLVFTNSLQFPFECHDTFDSLEGS